MLSVKPDGVHSKVKPILQTTPEEFARRRTTMIVAFVLETL